MADVAQPRRSRRFSFSSRRPQSVAVPNETRSSETKSSPPVTTIGFPIDGFPLSSDTQQEHSSWRNVFRRSRSQSVDRTNTRATSRATSSDRQSARRLVKKPPMNKDAKLSTQVPTLPDISLLANEPGSSNSARVKDVVAPPTKAKSSHSSSFGRGRSDTAVPQQKDNQPKARTFIQTEAPPAPATPTLRRVNSPFYHTASNRPAVETYGVRTTVTAGQPKSSLDTSGEDSMIPDSLRVGRSKKQSQATPTESPDSPTRDNFFKLTTSDFELPDYPAEQSIDESIANLSLQTDQTSSRQSLGIESYDPGERPIKTVRPLRTTTSRPHHAKTPSSSSSSSAASSAFSALGEPATPVSSNASSTNLDTTSFGSATAKKEIPRNTMSPKHDKYLAKIFVVCCRCNYWHDVPSGLYAQMVIPECMLFSGLPEPSGARSSRSSSQARSAKSGDSKYSLSSEATSFSSKSASSSSSPRTTVKCSWCRHEMAKSCCASWTTMVHLIEKHH